MHPKDEDIHAELMRLFRKYFEENQHWFDEDTHASSIRIRNLLSDIRRACSARRKDIRLWQIDKRAILDARKIARAQKKQAGGDKSGN